MARLLIKQLLASENQYKFQMEQMCYFLHSAD